MNIQISKSSMEYQSKTLRSTIVLGVFFLLLTTTYSSFSQIITYITQNADEQFSYTGEVSLIVNYITYLVGLTSAPSLFKFKKLFLLAALCYFFNYALYLLELENIGGLIISIIGAIVGGYGASILWVSQGGYMMRLFKTNKIEQNQEGRYFGILNGLVFANSLMGAIITTFFLGLFGNRIYFVALMIVALVSFLLCHFLLDPLQVIPENQQRMIHAEDPNVTGNCNCRTFIMNLKQVIEFYPKMRHTIIAIVLDGLILGFVATNYSTLLPVDLKTDLNVGILLIIHGVGGILGGTISGFLSDYMTVPQEGNITFLFILVTMLVTSLKVYVQFQTLTFAFCVSLCWGVSLYSLEGWIFVSCAKVYSGKIQSFAIVKQIHSLSFILFQIYMIVANQQIHLMITLCVFMILCLLSCLGVFLLKGKLKNNDLFVEEIEDQGSPSEDD